MSYIHLRLQDLPSEERLGRYRTQSQLRRRFFTCLYDQARLTRVKLTDGVIRLQRVAHY